MQIERVYKPNMSCQLQAIVLILRIALPPEHTHSVKQPRENLHSSKRLG